MRKKRHEEHVNHEAWAIPYADLMTLLLAFFVVMYAVSVVNMGKYRVASAALSEAFNGSHHVAVPQTSDKASPKSREPSIALPTGASATPPRASAAQAPNDLRQIESQMRKALQPLIDQGMVAIRSGPDRLEIEIRTDVLFPSGVASLSAPAVTVLGNMAGVLAPFGNSLRVEGFTDNVPIATSTYPSNWELSAARAASVARLFAEHGVAPDRLGIVGWGEVRPIADNATAEGRNRNRRVLVVVMGGQEPAGRPQQDVRQLATDSALSPATAATAAVATATATATATVPASARSAASAVPAVPAVPTAALATNRRDVQPPAAAVPPTAPAAQPRDGKTTDAGAHAGVRGPGGLR